MKKTTLVVLTIASAAGMASIANAVPFGPNDLQPGLSNQGGLPPGLSSQDGFPPGSSSQGGGIGNNPLVALNTSTNTPVVGVPEGRTSVLLLGAGLVVLALWRRRWQQSSY